MCDFRSLQVDFDKGDTGLGSKKASEVLLLLLLAPRKQCEKWWWWWWRCLTLDMKLSDPFHDDDKDNSHLGENFKIKQRREDCFGRGSIKQVFESNGGEHSKRHWTIRDSERRIELHRPKRLHQVGISMLRSAKGPRLDRSSRRTESRIEMSLARASAPLLT